MSPVTCTSGYASTCWILARSAGRPPLFPARSSARVCKRKGPPARAAVSLQATKSVLHRCHAVPNCGDARTLEARFPRIPQRRHVSRRKKGNCPACLLKILSVRRLGLSNSPPMTRIAVLSLVPANHHPTKTGRALFAFACPRSLDHAQSAHTRLYERPSLPAAWSTHPGLALKRFASILVFDIVVSPALPQQHLYTINHQPSAH